MGTSNSKSLQWFLILLIGGLAVVSRFIYLDVRPVAHDESLFAVYAWDLAQGRGYEYDPMLHGPLLLEIQAVVFSIKNIITDFSSAEFPVDIHDKTTMRSVVAIFGLLLFTALWIFKPWLKSYGLLFASILLLTSPTLLFYSRFLRNDIPFLYATLLFIGCLGRAFGRHETKFIFPAILSAALMACIKENTVFVLFTCACFSALILILDQWMGTAANKTYDWYSAGMFDHPELPLRRLVTSLIFTAGLAAILLLIDLLFILPIAPNFQLQHLPGSLGVLFQKKNLWITLPFLFLTTALLINFAIGIFEERIGKDQLWHKTKKMIMKNRYAVGAGILGAIILGQFVFTIGFNNPDLLHRIAGRTVAYWWHEHATQRLAGPYHYYWSRLLVYEAPLLFIIFASLVFRIFRLKLQGLIVIVTFLLIASLLIFANGANGEIDAMLGAGGLKFLHMSTVEHLILALAIIGFSLWLMIVAIVKDQERFFAFALCWSAVSILCYSYAGEKVPWLVVHVTLPLIVLAGYELKQFFKFLKDQPVVLKIASTGFLALLIFWNAYNCWRSAIMNFGDPYEIIVHNHTTFAFETKAKEVRLAEKIIRESKDEIVNHTLVKGEAVWPMTWYLRDTQGVVWDETLNTTDGFGIILRDFELDTPSSATLEIIPQREHWELHYMTESLFPTAPLTNTKDRLIYTYICLPAFYNYFVSRNVTTLPTLLPQEQKAIAEIEFLTMPMNP